MNVINKQHIRTPLAPTSFAFGGATKPISELMFNKYDKDRSGMKTAVFSSFHVDCFFL